MKITQMTIHSNLSAMKNKILQTLLQGNYRDGYIVRKMQQLVI